MIKNPMVSVQKHTAGKLCKRAAVDIFLILTFSDIKLYIHYVAQNTLVIIISI